MKSARGAMGRFLLKVPDPDSLKRMLAKRPEMNKKIRPDGAVFVLGNTTVNRIRCRLEDVHRH